MNVVMSKFRSLSIAELVKKTRLIGSSMGRSDYGLFASRTYRKTKEILRFDSASGRETHETPFLPNGRCFGRARSSRKRFVHRAAHAQPTAPPDSKELHVVGSGEDRSGKSHSLGFSTILFKVTTAETEGQLFLMEHEKMKPGGGPNLHLNLNQDEWFYVIEGEVAFQVGEQRLHLHAGESVLAPTPGRMLIGFRPGARWNSSLSMGQAQTHPNAALDSMKRGISDHLRF